MVENASIAITGEVTVPLLDVMQLDQNLSDNKAEYCQFLPS